MADEKPNGSTKDPDNNRATNSTRALLRHIGDQVRKFSAEAIRRASRSGKIARIALPAGGRDRASRAASTAPGNPGGRRNWRVGYRGLRI